MEIMDMRNRCQRGFLVFGKGTGGKEENQPKIEVDQQGNSPRDK